MSEMMPRTLSRRRENLHPSSNVRQRRIFGRAWRRSSLCERLIPPDEIVGVIDQLGVDDRKKRRIERDLVLDDDEELDAATPLSCATFIRSSETSRSRGGSGRLRAEKTPSRPETSSGP